MYIVLESYASNDPRLVPEIQFLEQYTDWIFEVAYINDDESNKVELSKINHVIVTENIARACKFTNMSDDFRLSVMEGTEIEQELFVNTSEPPERHLYKPKVYYTMTDKDKKDLMEFYKIEMNLYLNYHYNNLSDDDQKRNKAYRSSLEREIAEADSVVACRILMHKKFGLGAFNSWVKDHNLGPSEIKLHR